MSPIVSPAATPIEIAWWVRPRLAFIEPSIGSMTTSTSSDPKSTRPRSSDNASGRAVTCTYPRTVPRDLDALTPAQRTAVTHAGGPLLVLGGPGTGKTRVLVERVAWLAENGVAPEDVLLVGGSPAPAASLRTQVE